MQVHDHDHARLNSDSKQSDVADPDCHTEVVAKQPLQDQAAGHGIKSGQNEHRGFSDGVEDHVKQEENDKEHNRENDFEPLLGPQFELILS